MKDSHKHKCWEKRQVNKDTLVWDYLHKFEKVEKTVISQGKNVEEMTMAELDAVWDSIKHEN